MSLPLEGPAFRLRRWRSADAPALARHADDRRIWRNLRDAFPHPYTERDAQEYLASAVGSPAALCIEVDGEAAGGIALKLLEDVERVGAELGYWLGCAHWGRGIVSGAVALATPHFLEELRLARIFALPFARNAPSARVLVKAGFVLEGRLRHSAIKEGELQDQLLFAYVPGAEGGTAHGA